jgi:hypothetical protein
MYLLDKANSCIAPFRDAIREIELLFQSKNVLPISVLLSTNEV